MTLVCPTCAVPFASPKARASHERIHAGPTVAERLWSRVDRSGPVPMHRPDLGPCWVWTGHRVADGYGRMVVDGRSQGVHRISLSLALGRPLAPGMDACHRCDNPPCVRASHPFEAPHVANVADRHAKRRDASGRTNGRARLTPDGVGQIRTRLASGTAWSVIAAEMGVSKGAIQAIAVGRTWRHVELVT